MNANILVIDDEESIRFSFGRFLAAEGHNVITVAGYREALARMDKTEFDLILADIFLGDGWGIDILGEVMQRNLKTRVIIMTAYPSTETARDSLRMHAVDYLVKPLKQGGLLNSVNKALLTIRKMEPVRQVDRDNRNQATIRKEGEVLHPGDRKSKSAYSSVSNSIT
jgi:two-component system, NtrC family, response regulator HydG